MNTCPYCGTALTRGGVCPLCGAAVSDEETEYVSVAVTLSPSEARRGCMRTLRYPGAPEPMPVELPGGLSDGDALFVDGARFYENYGDIVERPLRLVVRVQKPRRRGYGAVAALLFVAAAALGVLLVFFARDLRGARQDDETPVTPAPVVETAAPETEPPEPTPEPLSAVQQRARELIPHFELRYYLGQLDDRLLENFCTLYEAVDSFETQCTFPQTLSRDELSNLMLLLSYECPELLQFSTATEITFYTDSNGRVVSTQLPLTMTREQYVAEYRVCAGVAAAVAQKANGLSEYEKELVAYNYIASNCFYNYDAPNASSAYGALGDRSAKCDGISLAMKWLCEEMGISCMVMAGNAPGNPIGHAWNVVCIDGTYYDLDVTNDVNSADRDYNYYGAFNVSRRWIRNKYTESVSFSGFLIVPGSESMNMSYHALNGSFVMAGTPAEELLYRQLDALDSSDAVLLQFESWDEYTAFINDINAIMGRWSGLSKGSFNYSLSHLDEFQVCRISVTYL